MISAPLPSPLRRPAAVCLLLGLLLLTPGCTKETAASQPPQSDPPASAAEPSQEPQPNGEQEPTQAPSLAASNLLLVNWEHPLSDDFTVPELTQLRNNQSIDSRVYPALQAMMDAARAEGLQPLICSSFRTWDTQERLFENEVQSWLDLGYSRTQAEEQAAMWVARPGTSEHQAGLAVDIVDISYQILDEKQASTPVQQWLTAHCAEYGFILRYPAEKSQLTGVGYEPWHYRYVGTEAAKIIMEQGLCLEEYLAG